MDATKRRGAEEIFVLSAMLSLLGALAWASIDRRLWAGHFYRIPLFGLTHVVTLGWLSLIIQGVLLRLTPMLLGVEPRGSRWTYPVCGLWLLGASGMVAHMLRGDWFGVWTAALCVWAAAALLPVLHSGVIRRARDGNVVARYAALAMAHLILAASVGVFIGLNKHLEWVAVDPMVWVGVHFHLAEVGWVTFMILGFGRKLLPGSAPAPGREPGESRLRLGGLEVGLALTIGGLLTGRILLAVGACLLAASLAAHLRKPLRDLITGKIQDRASFWASVAAGFLVLDAAIGVLLALHLESALPWTRDRLLFAYGVIALLGWNTLAITSFALKLFPLWVWQERFGPEWGIRPVPAVKDLYRPWLQEATGLALTLGTLLLAAGLVQGWADLALWGARVAGLGGLCFLVNFVLMSRWALLPVPFHPGPEDWERFQALRGEQNGASPS
jgi:hypothetical protein